jgi:ornithine carbamoyltransferase
MRHFLKDTDISSAEQRLVLDRGHELKANPRKFCHELAGHTIGLFFEKHSLRTRVSSEVACYQLGAHAISLQGRDLQIARGETANDTARVLGGYLSLLMGRVNNHSTLEAFAQCNCLPVVNGLSERYHPLQALADLLTIEEEFGSDLRGKNLVYFGDANNVCRSLALSSILRGMNVTIASPDRFSLDPETHSELTALAQRYETTLTLTTNPVAAASEAHVLYTDVWTSMGDENQENDRVALFAPYQINDRLVSMAHPDAIVLHCLPAHRGEDITSGVLDGPRSRVFRQAHNRLPATAALFLFLLTAK